jgi:hypothetical protein
MRASGFTASEQQQIPQTKNDIKTFTFITQLISIKTKNI